MLDGIVDSWLDPITEINVAVGVPPELARAHARLGIAVTRGLLLDLLATRDVDAVDAAMRAFIDVYAEWLERRRGPLSPLRARARGRPRAGGAAARARAGRRTCTRPGSPSPSDSWP